MNHQPPPRIAVPLDLCGETAAKRVELLLQAAHGLEHRYCEQLDRYHNGIGE